MYERTRTVVRSAIWLMEEFEVNVGLHEGLAFRPCLFAIIMSMLTKDVRKDSPLDMTFVDGVVLCREDRQELEASLERWKKVLEGRGLKVSWNRRNIFRLEERSKE